MTYQIALNFEDGVTRFISANAGEAVADAAYRQGVNVPLDCRDGACGTCKAFCQSGTYDAGFYIEDALTDDEAEQGYVLCCQTKAESDLVIDIPASSAACKTAPAEIEAEVVAVERLSPNRVSLAIRAKAGVLPVFLPGQYVNVAVPGGNLTRSYSFSSAPGAETATFLIRNIPGGAMSGWLENKAAPGETLTIRGALGSFYMRDVKRPLLLLAGGTGLAPILSMMEVLAEKGVNGHPVRLIYGVHEDHDLVEIARIEALAARIPGFSWISCCSSSDSGHDRTGFVTDHFGAEALNDGDADIYLCGPPVMVEAVKAHVSALGLSLDRLYFEKFTPAAEALAA